MAVAVDVVAAVAVVAVVVWLGVAVVAVWLVVVTQSPGWAPLSTPVFPPPLSPSACSSNRTGNRVHAVFGWQGPLMSSPLGTFLSPWLPWLVWGPHP